MPTVVGRGAVAMAGHLKRGPGHGRGRYPWHQQGQISWAIAGGGVPMVDAESSDEAQVPARLPGRWPLYALANHGLRLASGRLGPTSYANLRQDVAPSARAIRSIFYHFFGYWPSPVL
jgi:hypothetical protein